MIQQFFDSMITLMLAKFMLNDVPHALGLSAPFSQPEVKTTWELEDTIKTDTGIVKFYIGRAYLLINGEEVGRAAYRATPEFKSGSLVAIVIDEEFRGRGYSSLLLDRAIGELGSRGITRIATSVVGSNIVEGMLTRRGFKPFEEDPTKMYREATG